MIIRGVRLNRLSTTITAIYLLAAACLCGASTAANAGIEVTHLRCEYLANPRGIDVKSPRVRWRISERGKSVRGLGQIAYRVLVASSPELLNDDKGDLWDSEVKSDQSIHIVYGGKELTSRARCFPKPNWTKFSPKRAINPYKK